MPQVNLTQSFVDKAKPPTSDRTLYWAAGFPGFGLQVTAKGQKAFVFQYRVGAISRRMKLDGSFLRHEAERAKQAASKVQPLPSGTPLENAKREAKAVQGALANGRDPLAELHKTTMGCLQAVAEEYLEGPGKGLRTLNERTRVFKHDIYPRLGKRPIDEIKRSEITSLIETIAKNQGPVAAEKALLAIRSLMNWYAVKNDDFRSPIVGVKLSKLVAKREKKKARALTDDEVRVIWTVAQEHTGPYDYLLQFILLTATRRGEAGDMNRCELNTDGTDWTIPAKRYKGTKDKAEDHLIPLSARAQALLSEVPAVGRKGLVFTTNGHVSISGFSKAKKAFDQRVLAELQKRDPNAKPLPKWTTHSLRHTAKTLMLHAGVLPHITERALGHVIEGVEGIYDHYEYKKEKRHAFEALAAQIDRIVNPKAKVVPFRHGTLNP